MDEVDLVSLVTVPFFSGAIGYLTNWTGVWMLFNPIQFKGFHLPGLRPLVHFLPRKIQQIPGFMQGGVGWQGIIPSRAAKMGSIAVDKGIAKLGNVGDFYEQLEPEKIAEYMIETSRDDVREVVERIMQREHPQLWQDIGAGGRERVHDRVQQQLPDIIRTLSDEIGTNVDQLADVKLMVIRTMEQNPELANRVYLEVARKELRMMVNFGFIFGFLLGIPVAVLTEVLFHVWWLLPICGVIVGYVTNLIGIWMIFEPIEPTKWGPIKMHGLFLRRQKEVAKVYAKIIADDIVTLRNLGYEMLRGPSADRTRQVIERCMRPAVDRAAGVLQPALRVAIGTREYDAIRSSVATETVESAVAPMTDPEFSRQQSDKVRDLIAQRMREMSYADFSEMLRTAMREDEWLLYLHGAVLGLGGGLIHLAIFG
jgi:uncharacterized membrane protein YheB (UPF0754 family)